MSFINCQSFKPPFIGNRKEKENLRRLKICVPPPIRIVCPKKSCLVLNLNVSWYSLPRITNCNFPETSLVQLSFESARNQIKQIVLGPEGIIKRVNFWYIFTVSSATLILKSCQFFDCYF